MLSSFANSWHRSKYMIRKWENICYMRKDDNFQDNPDLVSRIFGRFLPKPEEIGLKRYNPTTRPENFPCVKDRVAELLPQDLDPEIRLLRPLLAGTNLEYRPLQCIYDANKDGWKASSFHTKVDKKGPALVSCRLQGDADKRVFGGYNPTGWVNYGEYRGSIAAFLFATNPTPTEASASGPFIKLAKISGAGLAQIDDGSGPKFGMEGLTIPLEKASPKRVRSKLGLYYEYLPNNKGNSILPGNIPQGELCDLKVYVGVYSPEEKIPYSDALPFALN